MVLTELAKTPYDQVASSGSHRGRSPARGVRSGHQVGDVDHSHPSRRTQHAVVAVTADFHLGCADFPSGSSPSEITSQ